MSNMIERLENLKQHVVGTLESVDGPASEQGDPFQSSNVISEAASHDFTSYLFAYEPLVRADQQTLLSTAEEDLFLGAIRAAILAGVPEKFELEELGWAADWDGRYEEVNVVEWDWSRDPLYSSVALARRLFHSAFVRYNGSTLAAKLSGLPSYVRHNYGNKLVLSFQVNLAARLRSHNWPTLFRDKENLVDEMTSKSSLWTEALSEALQLVQSEESGPGSTSTSQTRSYGSATFTPFERATVNFGLQLVYRQVWAPAGTQVGDIVKTIPLGPGQKEKVSIKSVRRQSTRQSFEQSQSNERSSELTSASKDSAEIVDEASSSFNWNAEVSAKASFGFGEASASASMGGESADSSRTAKSKANEAMQKSADKLRTETKVIISSERESTDTYEQVSEISNNNDETAVTYVYSKLQRQYEVYTYLAEVNTVAFVAEPVPGVLDISADWIDSHAHILSGALIDGRYAQDLERVLDRRASNAANADLGGDSNLRQLMEKLVESGLPDNSRTSGTPPDTVSSLLHTYLQDKQAARQREAEDQARRESLERLKEHVAEHALYYARHVWLSEASDSRMMRYRNILVPRDWRVTNPVGRNYGEGGPGQPSMMVPVVDQNNPMLRLTDIISPAGPVGLAGNYLAFDMTNSPEIRHIDAPLSLLRMPYSRKHTWFEPQGGATITAMLDPGMIYPSEAIELELRTSLQQGERHLELTIRKINGQTGARTFLERDYGTVDSEGLIAMKRLRGIIAMSGTAWQTPIVFKGRSVMLPELEDPDFARFRWSQFGTVLRDAENILGQHQLNELRTAHAHEMSDLGLESSTGIGDLSLEDRARLVDLYISHQFITDNTRRVLLDTDNVVLSRIADNASSLEPFKAAHRQIDLLKALEEVAQELRESERLEKRLTEGLLDDPQVDSYVRVDGGGNVCINPER